MGNLVHGSAKAVIPSKDDEYRPCNYLTNDASPSSALPGKPMLMSIEGYPEKKSQNDLESKLPLTATSSTFHPEMEVLAQCLDKNLVLRDVATKTSNFISVPKGYLMDSEVKPSTFYQSRAEVRTYAKKRKREIGILPKSKRLFRHERHGFRPQEVNWNGAVHLENCKTSNLTNDIHPMFDRCSFDDTPDIVYDQLIPGLQLASMFLSQPVCMKFFVTLAMGERRDDVEMSLQHGRRCKRIDSHVDLTESRAREVIKHINELANSRLIHFVFRHGVENGNAWALSGGISDYEGIGKDCGANNYGPNGLLIRSIISLHADVYITAKKLSELKYLETSQKLRFNFYFAVLIMHELVSQTFVS